MNNLMNTKNNRNTKQVFDLLLVFTLLAAVSGCGGNSNTNQSNANATPSPSSSPTVSPTATPAENPTAKLAGVWETKYDISNIMPGYPASSTGVGQFAKWKWSEGVKKGDDYVGRITNELNNENIAEYSVVGKSITLTFLPVSMGTTQTSGTSRTYEYELANDDKMLTLKGSDPIVLTKGSNNADMETVSYVISDKVDWMMRPPKTIDPSQPEAHYVTFGSAQKFDNGYGGKMEFWNEDPYTPSVPHTVVATGQYLLTSKTKVTITIGGGPKSGTYKLIDNRVLQIDFTDPSEQDLVLTAR